MLASLELLFIVIVLGLDCPIKCICGAINECGAVVLENTQAVHNNRCEVCLLVEKHNVQPLVPFSKTNIN